ncbi:uncharacterized protein LOC122051251 isoform X2 [Zingiber officinale]|uniref:uncharacterized protein LOC122051251 isoform X2 n=1 Tax=Zingiber officinale TaxID=94328 RepID=UPI001C4D7BE9|nr:uncharacterized protein LOC122051251 isoform X2 [Zingiber officinale]
MDLLELHRLVAGGAKPGFDPFNLPGFSASAAPAQPGSEYPMAPPFDPSAVVQPPPPLQLHPPPPPAEMQIFGLMESGGRSGRWPRQETLTLLEVRSRLDSRFREAAQKGPLWDEVSRIMAEEHGYQRSGRKCREKLENLYKYYKKTKEGKAGRQDGKHYRFFRQLEALYEKEERGTDCRDADQNPNFSGGNRVVDNINATATTRHRRTRRKRATGLRRSSSAGRSVGSSRPRRHGWNGCCGRWRRRRPRGCRGRRNSDSGRRSGSGPRRSVGPASGRGRRRATRRL